MKTKDVICDFKNNRYSLLTQFDQWWECERRYAWLIMSMKALDRQFEKVKPVLAIKGRPRKTT